MFDSLIDPFRLFYKDKSLSLDISFFSILLMIIPISLITGPALPDILLSTIAFYFLIKSFSQKLWSYYNNPIVIGFLLFSSYGILRSLFSEIPFESLTKEGSVFYFRYIFFAMGVWYLLDKNNYLPKCLISILISCIVLVSIDGLYQYFFDFNLFGNPKFTSGRLTGLMGDEPIIGRYITYCALFTVALIYQNFDKSKKILFLTSIFLLICTVTVFLSGERAPFLYLVSFIFITLILFPNLRIYNLFGIIISIIILMTFIQFKPAAKIRMIDYTITQINQLKIPILPFTDHHLEHIKSANKMFLANPFFGIGTNSFSFFCENPKYKISKWSCSTHPHNYYIQVISELGLVGLLFLVSFYLYCSFIFFKNCIFYNLKNKTDLFNIDFLQYLLILLLFWWPLIPTMSIYNNWNNVILMLPLGFFLKFFYGNKIYGSIFKN